MTSSIGLPAIDPSVAALLTDEEKKKLDGLFSGVVYHQAEKEKPTFADFLTTYVKIIDNEGQRLMRPWQWQIELAEAIPYISLGIILKGRQIGITWIFAAYAVYTALYQNGAQVLITSYKEDEAKEVQRRVRYIYDNLPPSMQPKNKGYNTSKLEFVDRHSLIQALPSTPNTGSSRTASVVIADEFAKQEYAESAFISLKPTAEHGGQFFLLSTAVGLGNMFAEVWLGKEGVTKEYTPVEQIDYEYSFEGQLEECSRSDKRWVRIYLPYYLRPGRDQQWWDNQYLTTPVPKRWSVYQEYPGASSLEAFQQTGKPVFELEALKKHREQCQDPLKYKDWPRYLKKVESPGEEEWPEIPCISLYENGLRIWSLPNPDSIYIAGIDVSEGLANSDACHMVVRDSITHDEVLTLHGFWAPDVYALLIDRIARVYPGLYGIERNNHGHAVIQKCKELGTPGLYREKPVYGRAGEVLVPGKLGWGTTRITKPLMIDELSEAVSAFAIRFNDVLNFDEFMPYCRFDNGKTGAPGNLNDDRVIASAICWQLRRGVVNQHIPMEATVNPGAQDSEAGSTVGSSNSTSRFRSREY